MPFRTRRSDWALVWPRASRDEHGAEKLLPLLVLTAFASAVAYCEYAVLSGSVGYWIGGGVGWAGAFWILRRSESIVVEVGAAALRIRTREGVTLRPRVTALPLEDIVAVLDGWESFVFGKVHCWVQVAVRSGDLFTIGPWASRGTGGPRESAELRDWLADAIGVRLGRSVKRGGRSVVRAGGGRRGTLW